MSPKNMPAPPPAVTACSLALIFASGKIKEDGEKQLIAKAGGLLSPPGYGSAYATALFIISNDA